MTKEDYIKYWIETAEKDWDVVDILYNRQKFLYSLFFSHLVLEKLAKALWVKNNEAKHPSKNFIILFCFWNKQKLGSRMIKKNFL